MSCLRRRRMPDSRSKLSASRRIRSKPSPHNISGASAPPANSSARARKAGLAFAKDDLTSPPHRERDEAECTHDDAPPGKKSEAVARDILQERFHHDDGDHEGDHEADRDDAQMIGRHVG